ncbi:hypothetical protein ACJJTC_010913, partial [Scirpophaga incertulas]
MPPLKTVTAKEASTPVQDEPVTTTAKPPPITDTKDEDRLDFVNVKDLIKGMERQKTKEPKPIDVKETNGFYKKIIDNGHDGYEKKGDDLDIEKEDESEKDRVEKVEKTDSCDSEPGLSRSNSLINGVPTQAPKPLPRSSISEAGSCDEPSEAPKPKPRTTTVPVSGYKPRLGPKPFSASTGSEEFSFDKVFSVPAVPGLPKSDSATSPLCAPAGATPSASTPIAKEEVKDKSLSPTSDVEAPKDIKIYVSIHHNTQKDTVSKIAEEFRMFKELTFEMFKLLRTQISECMNLNDISETRHRQNALVFLGVPEVEKEDCRRLILDTIHNNMGLKDLTESSIQSCHRLGIKNKEHHRPIVVWFSHYQARASVWKAKTHLKGSKVSLREFLTKTRQLVFSKARSHFGMRSCWTMDGVINIKTSDGKSHSRWTFKRILNLKWHIPRGSGGGGGGGQQSIADRRRAYEMRSVSVAVESDTPPSPAPLRRRDSLKSRKSPDREDKRASVPNVTTKRTSTVFGKVSKFRHLKGTPAHKSTHVENIKNISRQISGECNGFY